MPSDIVPDVVFKNNVGCLKIRINVSLKSRRICLLLTKLQL